jgi:hypothetical protein
LNEDSHAYLLPEYEMDGDREALLAECYDDIELMGWWTDESAHDEAGHRMDEAGGSESDGCHGWLSRRKTVLADGP